MGKFIGKKIFNEVLEYVLSADARTLFIGGGSCSGKTTLAKKLSEGLSSRGRDSIIITMDDFYIGNREMKLKGIGGNYDHPSAIDFPRLRHTLERLVAGEEATKPVYDFISHERFGYESIEPKSLIILEGLYALHHWVSGFGDMRLFIECSIGTMLKRRLRRDRMERGREVRGIRDYFMRVTLPMFKKFVSSTYRQAHIVIDG